MSRPTLVNMTGQRFGRLLVIEQRGNKKWGAAIWLCRCDCGTEKTVCGPDLRKGTTTSCGCFKRDYPAARTHGGTGSRLYLICKAMRQRCENPRDEGFKNYGGRGITVCSAWRDFAAFQDWALQNGYADHLTLERIDVNGNYEPANCTWADQKTQARNKRNTLRREDGTPWMTVAEENAIPYRIFSWRIHNGWPAHEAASWPHEVGRKTFRVKPSGRPPGATRRTGGQFTNQAIEPDIST